MIASAKVVRISESPNKTVKNIEKNFADRFLLPLIKMTYKYLADQTILPSHLRFLSAEHKGTGVSGGEAGRRTEKRHIVRHHYGATGGCSLQP